MIQDRPWIALYSHTGSEIRNISLRMNNSPDLIITNSDRPALLFEQSRNLPKKPTVDDYLKAFSLVEGNPIITLHGWMRIIPEEICDKFDIYNLHPGLITDYPELKGKDPQEKIFKMLNLPSHVGCVIHKASAEVDSGEIIMSRRVFNSYPSVNILTEVLHTMAGDMWVDFFEKQLYNGV